MSPTSAARWDETALRCLWQMKQGSFVCSGLCATQPVYRQGAHREPQTGLQNRCRNTFIKVTIESCLRNQQCEPKKISAQKTQKPQRFLGFLAIFQSGIRKISSAKFVFRGGFELNPKRWKSLEFYDIISSTNKNL